MKNEIFVEKPNLPAHLAAAVIMSDRYPELVRELRDNYSVRVITPQPLEEISGSERFHADMAVCHLGGTHFVVSPSSRKTAEKLSQMGADVVLSGTVTAAAPALNVLFLGKRMFCCKKTVQPEILSYCEENGISVIHTNQKYTRCCAAVINENAVITADESIYRACLKNGADVLKIPPGGIVLEGYSYGFIGGACGLISSDILAFAGKAEKLKSFCEIKAFAANYGVDIVSLGSDTPYDIGGILAVTERAFR